MELLMAATMFSILAVGLSAHLRGGVTAWRRASSTVEALQALRVTRDRLARDLANAVVFDQAGAWNPKPIFGTDTLQFYARQQMWREGRAHGEVAFIRYELASEKEAHRLQRSVQSVQAAASSEPASAEWLLQGVRSWRMRYGYAGEEKGPRVATPEDSLIEWRDAWDHETPAVPKLIEVTIELATPIGHLSSIRAVVLIPHGVLGTAEQP